MGDWSQAFLEYYKPRSQWTGSQWADECRYIPPGTSPEPGPWRTSRVPYLREPMDVATDRITEFVVLMFSSQVAKSEFQLNVMGYYAHQDPCAQLVVYPTEKLAETFSKSRIDPMFQYSDGLKDINTDVVAEMVGDNSRRKKKKKANNTILEKYYPGGYIAMVGSESEASLAGRPIRILHVDEVDRCADTAEGDSLKLAIQRTTNFEHNRKILLASTPTVKGESKIEKWWEESDKRYYHVACPHCGEFQFMKWGQVRWDKDAAGNALPDTARLLCKECEGVMRGAGKPPAMLLANGFWVKTRPESKIAGFHINSLYSPWVSLSSLVREFVGATKTRDRKGLMEFINLKLGEPFEDRRNDLDYEALHLAHVKRNERYTDGLPNDVLMLTIGGDTQDNYIAAECVGFGMGKERWGIEYRIFYGDTSEDDVWQRFDEWRQSVWTRQDGVQLRAVATFVDKGGHRGDKVAEFCAKREKHGVWAIFGAKDIGAPMLGKPSRNNRWGAPVITLGVGALKSETLSAALIETDGPRFCHYNMEEGAGYDLGYFKGLLSERLEYKFDKEKGRTVLKWVQVHERNEPLDVRNYATAAMEMLNPNFEALAARMTGGVVAAPAPRRRIGVLSRGIT